ncbi:MAG: tetratricopeptide repeat protein [Microcoleus sp. PH2017_10_PVI_O_A]|uniref:tetratricopeptide repeat protein n=1 Tax=unclassified Microcoleus TaxID=2642155 RepID=UPI001DBB4D76|nr:MULTISPECIES: tetratricopeptide repeat protein [unclassified Microcoleus]TAE79240.1 MAG: tetratricopeptide repeat protein [Oscillatoriales cyanobacterium]MCC3408454.1 tetratricopeptide repeat protein [Microcoleus sp. PH2017_10_PVI_O_A]MCC3462545.1 tetratricopeptide repeat protein [Microcoleus sp. PH2017_11_PCY_U_A]MCC3480961.1 tetratricopeptide repeat protein [Microcoleus sp. PH2017_12_PCY_D_A]MCC3530403.1 tetratricopeptide repeat protein [Microcoleus sp. PH2017_21_RUC_O_A]
MANFDLEIPQERVNILSFLRQTEIKCSRQNSESNRSFDLAYQVWEKVSEQLWFLGYWNDYFNCGNIVLKSAKAVGNAEIKAQLLSELGWACMEWEEFAQAEKYFLESLQTYESIANLKQQCRLLRYLGVLSYRQRKLDSALKYYRLALDIVTANSTVASANDNWAFHEAELPNVLGEFYLDLQDFPASYRELNLSLERYRSLINKYRYYQADPLLNLGRWHFLQGDCETAKQYYQECLQLCKEINRPDTRASVLLNLAELAEARGKLEEAIELAAEAEQVAGTEVTSVRDRAARFREQLLTKKTVAEGRNKKKKRKK